jgi:hypothetical protein
MKNEQMCKKLKYKTSSAEPAKILFGLLVSEDSFFLKFRTNKHTYTIAKRCVISLEPTNRIFKEDLQ